MKKYSIIPKLLCAFCVFGLMGCEGPKDNESQQEESYSGNDRRCTPHSSSKGAAKPEDKNTANAKKPASEDKKAAVSSQRVTEEAAPENSAKASNQAV